eukprot:GHVP01056053.1.p1 GENE.GHVP01056053.1~~GHVP01056053.1.p1  ORF type:complete len:534 (-),score=88.51 GHVP01056053.1:98-1699(-)
MKNYLGILGVVSETSFRNLGPSGPSIGISQRCPVSLDLIINQDIAMFLPLWSNIEPQLREAIDEIQRVYIDPKFALSKFEDHPVPPLGSPDSICYEKVLPFTGDVEEFMEAFQQINIQKETSDDPSGSQYTAILSAALDTTIGWRGDEIETGPDSGTVIAKIILTITDSDPHPASDGYNAGLVRPTSPDLFPYQCQDWDYPEFVVVRDALEDRKAIPVFVTNLNPEKPVYEEFNKIIMEGFGAVAGKPPLVQLTREIILAVDEAMLLWCEKRGIDPTSTPSPPPVPTTSTTAPPTAPTTTEEACLTNDVMFVRDLSVSTLEDFWSMESYVETYIRNVPEGSRFALVSHTDKPIEPFGYSISMDYCFWLHQPFTSSEEFLVAYGEADTDHRSGGDFAENQLDALIKGIQSVQFSQENSKCNCVVILTDSFYHEAGDYPSAKSAYEVKGEGCVDVDYPTTQQVADQLMSNGISCLTIATFEEVLSYWEEFRAKLLSFGFPPNIEIVILLPSDRRSLNELFRSQEKIDLRHLESRL